MVEAEINQSNSIFLLLSFEGPDIYSQAGGLGVRATNLSQTLAREGFATHLFFIGDPRLKGEEISPGGKLVLHRWCQWISAYYPLGCYQGENEKLADYSASIPPYLIENIIKPAVAGNKMVIVLAEEWQTAGVICKLNDLLLRRNLRDKAILFWNANNTFGFDRIDFPQLDKAASITTVSRYMKHLMWQVGINPVVISNGIPNSLLNRIDSGLVARLRKSLAADLILAKIARWDPDKRWNMAIAATARLKARGLKAKMLARGGMEGYGKEVLEYAGSLGLKVADVFARRESLDGYLEAIAEYSSQADLLNIRFHCPQDFLRLIYRASNAVLANSGREPFGLVGLETMAAGGLAFTGSTGEDYAIPFLNSIVLETSDPEEIESYVTYLNMHPQEEAAIRNAARDTAAQYTWEQVIGKLLLRLEYQARIQGLIATRKYESVWVPYRLTPPHGLPS
jgi:glycosyltransferase involved in cell wall biosynthesis